MQVKVACYATKSINSVSLNQVLRKLLGERETNENEINEHLPRMSCIYCFMKEINQHSMLPKIIYKIISYILTRFKIKEAVIAAKMYI